MFFDEWLKIGLCVILLLELIIHRRLKKAALDSSSLSTETPVLPGVDPYHDLKEECNLARLIGFILLGQNAMFGFLVFVIFMKNPLPVHDLVLLRLIFVGLCVGTVTLIPLVKQWLLNVSSLKKAKGDVSIFLRRKLDRKSVV